MPVVLPSAPDITSWSRLRRTGWSPAAVRAQLDAGRWRRHGLAIARHNGPLTREQRWFVAQVHGGPRSLLTAFTSLEAYGLRGWERDDVHLLLPVDARCSPRSPVPVVVHRRRHWHAVRVSPRTCVQIPRQAVVVAASSLPSVRAACGLLAAAVQQRLVAAATVRAVVTAAPNTRHRHALLLALDDIEQGADALSEIDFVRLCRRAGLPPPVQQAVRRERDGRRRYLDATWRRADGRLVVVEVDGALHLSVRRWWDDQLRQNEIALSDALVLRYPSVVVRTEPATVVAQLRRALGR